MKHILLYCMLIALMASVMPAQADWNETGFPLEDHLVAQGTVNGSVYVGGGHGKSGVSAFNVPYTELLEVPPGDVKFARLYTGAGLLAKPDGGAIWLNMTLNGESLGNLTIRGKDDDNENVYIFDSAYGGWIWYNVTDMIVSGTVNNATLYGDAIYDADGKNLGWGTKYIGGIVLVVVYEDQDKPETQYWIREGADYLHKESSYIAEKKNTTATFPGADNGTCENATLYTVARGATNAISYNETLWVNGELAASNLAGDRNGRGLDINRTEITEYLRESGNYVTYERGDGSLNIGCAVLVLGKIEIIPDLTIQGGLDVSLKTGEETIGVVANHDYVVEAEIKNKGTGASNGTTATLFDNGTPIGSVDVPSIDSLNITTVAFNWAPISGGMHILNVTIDPNNTVNESIEFNNNLSQDVYVYSEGLADMLPEIAFFPTRDTNETTINVTVTNNGTADVHDLKVSLVMDGITVANNMLSLPAKSIDTTEFVYSAQHLSTHAAEIKLDPDDTITEGDETNNNVSDTFKTIEVHITARLSWVNGTTMFDYTKLVPEEATVDELLESVANVTHIRGSKIPFSIDGVERMPMEGTWWCLFVNGLPYIQPDEYQLHDREFVLFTYDRSIGVMNYFFRPRPVLQYPEPFLHGSEGTVPNTTIVYPAGFEGDADTIRNQLIDYGVVNVTTSRVGDMTGNQTENDNLVLLGTHDTNDLIREVSESYYLVGLPVYFKDGLMHDSTTRDVYSAGGMVAACDNPYDNSPGYVSHMDAGPSIFMVAGIDDDSAHAAASLLSTPDQLDCFWKFVSTVEVMKGDLNSDDDITTADAVIALQMAAGSRTPDMARGDVNNDGMVTSLDALMVMQAAAGSINL